MVSPGATLNCVENPSTEPMAGSERKLCRSQRVRGTTPSVREFSATILFAAGSGWASQTRISVRNAVPVRANPGTFGGRSHFIRRALLTASIRLHDSHRVYEDSSKLPG